MKKVVLSFVILGMSLATFATPSISNQLVVSKIVLQDDFADFKKEDLPVAITNALKAKYPKAVIEKAYINAYKLYKLEITNGSLKETLLCTDKGQWIQ